MVTALEDKDLVSLEIQAGFGLLIIALFIIAVIFGLWLLKKVLKYVSHFSYACKMRYPLNLVLESWEYLWFYLTFWVVILDYGLKLHKLSIHTLVML